MSEIFVDRTHFDSIRMIQIIFKKHTKYVESFHSTLRSETFADQSYREIIVFRGNKLLRIANFKIFRGNKLSRIEAFRKIRGNKLSREKKK